MVMGGDSCAKGREFESQHHILDGHLIKVLSDLLPTVSIIYRLALDFFK